MEGHLIREVVINACYGGFSLSKEGFEAFKKLEGNTAPRHCRDIARDNANLVRVVKEMGTAANGRYASLRVVEIPLDVEWELQEYDGHEHVAEKHRTWP